MENCEKKEIYTNRNHNDQNFIIQKEKNIFVFDYGYVQNFLKEIYTNYSLWIGFIFFDLLIIRKETFQIFQNLFSKKIDNFNK